MKNRKAKRLFLQRPVRVVELVISNHKIAVLHPFGQVAFAAKRSYCVTEQAEERVRCKMKNRKAKILLVRRNAPGVWQWVRLSNRRMGLMKYYGMMDCGFCKKPSAAQNRWKNHLRTKGE